MRQHTQVVTPVGKLMWVTITGEGRLNFNEDAHEYRASVVLAQPEANNFIAELRRIYQEHTTDKYTCRSMGYRACDENGVVLKEVEPEEAEYVIFNFKTNVLFADGKKKKIQVYNAKAARVTLGDTLVGNGSSGAISGSAGYYTNGRSDGISLWLNAVQIFVLEEYNQDPGFTASSEDGLFESVDSDNEFVGEPDKSEPESEPEKSAKPSQAAGSKTAKPRL